ncbi:hypothetical protein RND81_02G107000 [Saponaria officinalis]|uniref:Calcium ion-binding protein n=1 Tax=Saponaria officinalis TaxID=3572 RepID=A0AAW1MTE3_SAPOF
MYHVSFKSITLLCLLFFVDTFFVLLPFFYYCISSPSQMGLAASFLAGRGAPTTQMVNLVTGTLYNRFIEKDTNTFEEFHIGMLDIFNTFNTSLPGKHYDVPSRQEIEGCFEEWKKARNADKKQVFVNFIKSVNLNKLDNTTLITGVVTPPVAMVAKKAGESIAPLKMLKLVPDVLFVPSATFIALISVRISRSVVSRKKTIQLDEASGPTSP